jgi:UDP-glucose 4-epimerase
MTVLVTGGAGYIGSFTVRALLASGRKVVVVDSLEHGFIESMADGVPLVVANIIDAEVITQTCRQYNVDAVIHFAAYKAANESMDEPAKYFRNNSAGALALIEAVRAAGVSRFVFSSTAIPRWCPSPRTRRCNQKTPTANPNTWWNECWAGSIPATTFAQ